MTLSIKDPEADRLARELAKMTGTTITEAVIEAMREKQQLELARQKRRKQARLEKGMMIARHAASLPVLDTRTEDEILGYDENGLPT